MRERGKCFQPIMDWELKESAWDFTNMPLENNHDPRLATLIGSNNLRPDNNRGSFSVDLKLGRIGDNMGDDFRKIERYPSNSSSSGSSKRAKAVSGTQNVTCLVDGCVDDLRGCREYHRRHRVCERHSKTPVVTIGGYEKRFCQQCSRFQSVADFDEEKRSCRKRLDGHNRRRRKPQPEAFYTDHGSLFSNHQGTRLLQFGGLESYATSAFPTWPSAPTNPLLPNHSNLFPSSSANIHINAEAANKRFPFLLTNNPEISNNYQVVPEVIIHPRLAHSTPFANVNPHRVHSLLSSSPRPTQNSAFGTHHQQISPAHQYFRSPALVPQANNYQNSYNSDNETTMVSLSPDNLLEKGASQVFPFSWK